MLVIAFQELVDYDSNLSLLTQSRKSVEFPIIKKWTSPRLRSVSCNVSDYDFSSCRVRMFFDGAIFTLIPVF